MVVIDSYDILIACVSDATCFVGPRCVLSNEFIVKYIIAIGIRDVIFVNVLSLVSNLYQCYFHSNESVSIIVEGCTLWKFQRKLQCHDTR